MVGPTRAEADENRPGVAGTPDGSDHRNPIDLDVIYQVESQKLLTFPYGQVNALVAQEVPGRFDAHYLARTLLRGEHPWFSKRFRWLLPLVGIPLLVGIVSADP